MPCTTASAFSLHLTETYRWKFTENYGGKNSTSTRAFVRATHTNNLFLS